MVQGNGNSAKTLLFTIPSTAKIGTARLRIQMSYGSSFVDPCAVFNYGEVEDYTVNITGAASTIPLVSLAKDNVSKMSVSPNPVTGTNALINYRLAADGNTMINVIDINNRVIQKVDFGYQKAGRYTYQLRNSGTLETGTYIILLWQKNKIIERKLIMVSNKN